MSPLTKIQESEGKLLQNSSDLKRSNKLCVEELSEKTEDLAQPWQEVGQAMESTNDISRPKSGETRKPSFKEGRNGHTATDLSHDSMKVGDSSKPKRVFNARFPKRNKPKEHKSKATLVLTSPPGPPQTELDNKSGVTMKAENKRIPYSSHVPKQPTDVLPVQPLVKVDNLVRSRDETEGTKKMSFEEGQSHAALNIEDIGQEFQSALQTRDSYDIWRAVQADNVSTILSKQSTASTVASEPTPCSASINDKAENLCGTVSSTELLRIPEHRKPETNISTQDLLKAGPRLMEKQAMSLDNDEPVTTTSPKDIAICSSSIEMTTAEGSNHLYSPKIDAAVPLLRSSRRQPTAPPRSTISENEDIAKEEGNLPETSLNSSKQIWTIELLNSLHLAVGRRPEVSGAKTSLPDSLTPVVTHKEKKISNPLLKPNLEEDLYEPYEDFQAGPSKPRTGGILVGNEISTKKSTDKTSELMAMSFQTDDFHDQAQAKVSHAESSKPYNTTASFKTLMQRSSQTISQTILSPRPLNIPNQSVRRRASRKVRGNQRVRME